MGELMYIDGVGKVWMVDVGDKDVIECCVVVQLVVEMQFGIFFLIWDNQFDKGDVLFVVCLVGVMVVK